ncbi:energy transducer TonB [Roseateles sp. DXS20W]|uniref:Energy transducer TonB n=1 Tax=Pelomonas lactea TaxID=3299030 RepID=A0ABW7GLH9_9BURK
MRAGALLAVALLHGALLIALWPGRHGPAPGPRRELSVRLLPAAAAPVVRAPPRAAPRVAGLPAVAVIAPPGFDVQADPRSAPPMATTTSAPAPVVPVVPPAPPPPRDDPPPAAAPALQSARRAACAPAPHPLALRDRGIEGVVRLRVWVDELGRAGQVLLAASSGWRLFDDAAMAQARRCPFHPALRGNEPVGSWVEFPVRFALETADG